jgi:hypothetical protein
MLFRDKISDYSENHEKHTNTLCELKEESWYVNASGTYTNHWALYC